MASRNLAKDKRSFNLAIKDARIGHRESQYEVGLMYANGIGIDQDFIQAVYWINQSAERGFAAAQYLLATRYAAGEAVDLDEQLALKWYVKAADQGHPKAIHKLARFFGAVHPMTSRDLCLKAAKLGVAQAQFDIASEASVGQADTEGLHEAFLWCLQAAEQGLAMAQCSVAAMYEHGHGVAPDTTEAYFWYRKAARQYMSPAQVALSRLDALGQGRGQNNEREKILVGTTERRRDAQKWIQTAELGDSTAKYCLGLMYQNGWGITQDVEQAFVWIEGAAKLGNLEAKLALAKLFEGTLNYQGAFTLHKEIAEQNQDQTESFAALGHYCLEGLGVGKDDYSGVLWTMRAAERGNQMALEALADIFSKDEQRITLACLKKAADHGVAEAQYRLGALYLSDRSKETHVNVVIDWYRCAATQGHILAQCALGLLYSDGKKVPKDMSQAREWFLKAAEQGDAKAQWNLALMLVSGSGGVKKDLKQAFVLCQKAAQQGFVPAQATLGILFAKMKKPEKAVEWWRMAAEQGDPEAQFNLAMAFIKGQGVGQDMGTALNWLLKASEQGVVSAQSKLGLMYATGNGVVLDPIEAHKWFLVASHLGDLAAHSNVNHSGRQLAPMQVAEAKRRAIFWLETKGL